MAKVWADAELLRLSWRDVGATITLVGRRFVPTVDGCGRKELDDVDILFGISEVAMGRLGMPPLRGLNC